jgi:hypothetical protein
VSSARRFGYAQARIQARLSALPAESDWQRLSSARSLSGYLEEARDGALRTWVKGFSSHSNCHDLERGLRAQFLDTVEQARGFVPRPWRAAVDWCRWLPLLPLFAQVRRGGAMPDWTRRDYRLAGLLDGEGRFDAAVLRRRGIDMLAVPPGHADGHDGAAGVWIAQWRRRWPGLADADRRHLEDLGRRLDHHLRAFAETAPDKAWEQRRALRARLRLELHRQLLQPSAVFLYLALVAIDLERLRRALVDRALFDTGRAEAA